MKCRNSLMCVYASVHTCHFFFLCCFSWYTRGSGKKVIQSSKKNHCGVDVSKRRTPGYVVPTRAGEKPDAHVHILRHTQFKI